MAGRREVPVDPEAGPVQRFAYDLRKLRESAGRMTYRDMARRAGYSVTTLSQAAAGEQLPSLPVALAYATVCGGDPDTWEADWRRAADAVEERTARVVHRDASGAPYRGLARFEPGDHDLFFGRDTLVTGLTGLLAAHRLVMVTGASGSGKSSLLRAGLIARLRQPSDGESAPSCSGIRILTPGARPAATHAPVLTPRPPTAPGEPEPGRPRPGDTVIVVDQFEEVFTLCHDPAERARFIDLLLAARAPGSGLRAVVAVRADFYGHCTEHPELVDVLREAHLLVGPMTRTELRQSVVGPARAAGLIVERELTDRIVEETAGEPGALPLMSHALQEVWRRRRGRTLTLAAYEAVGGVRGAVADTAEETYTRLTPEQGRSARHMLLRLITPGQGSQDTRRPAPRSELEDIGAHGAAAVLESLARARLVTLDGDTADLAHEALITAWPRLRSWIDEERARLVAHRRLTDDAAAWEELGRDPDALYRGTRLAAAEEAFPPPHDGLTPAEHAFLTAGTTARDQEVRSRVRAERRLRRLIGMLAVLLVLALAGGLTAWQQSRDIARQRDNIIAAQSSALARQLTAQTIALFESNPELASLLAVHAYRLGPTAEATGSLYRIAEYPFESRRRVDAAPTALAALAPDLESVTYAADARTTRVYGIRTGRRDLTHPGPAGPATALRIAPDGLTSATAAGPAVALRDTATGRQRALLTGHRGTVEVLAYSPDSRTLAGAGADGTVILWDTRTGRVRTPRPADHPAPVTALALNGTTLATATADGTVRLVDTRTGRARVLTRDATRPRNNVTTERNTPLSFSPDGRTLAVGHQDGATRIWSTTTGRIDATFPGFAGSPQWNLFSPDGKALAIADTLTNTVRLWDVSEEMVYAVMVGHEGRLTALAFSRDSTTLATVATDRTVRLWRALNQQRHAIPTRGTSIGGLAFTRDGNTAVAATGLAPGRFAKPPRTSGIHVWNNRTNTLRHIRTDLDAASAVTLASDAKTLAYADRRGLVRITDTTTGRTRRTLRHPGPPPSAIALSADGTLLATGSGHTVRIWRTATGTLRRTLTSPSVGRLVFDPRGTTLAADGAGAVRLWDLATGTTRHTLNVPETGDLVFSPDGTTLATGGGSVRLWNTRTGTLRRTLLRHTQPSVVLAFSPDGRTLAMNGFRAPYLFRVALSGQDYVHLWDVATGQARRSFITTDPALTALAFSPDGRTLATGGSHGTIRLWAVSFPTATQAISQICRAVNRDLTPREHRNYLPGRGYTPACPETDKD
ncbi:helix-turn-helix domain-containing protein [Streptomyces sp. NPDC006798]|uniref:nSTAND1 domain-containing NTPase n=1 Tax=Streptomyces sp. NPDC006798 TaxID=3155462 RepID=UPI0033F8B80E